jgi:predicted permease
MHGILRDVRHGLSALVRDRRFTVAAVLTLALGLGATTTLYSVVKAVLLSPLPYTDPDHLVVVWRAAERGETTWLSMREVIEYRAASRTLERVEAYADLQASFTDGDRPERVPAAAVTAGLFEALGTATLLGRAFTPHDGEPGADPVVILGHGLWQRRFGGDPSWVGRTVAINGVARTVVGVMPGNFALPRDFASNRPTETWIPVSVDRANPGAWGSRSYIAVGRLSAGASATSASAELRLIADRWVQAGFVRDQGDGALHRDAVPMGDFVTGDVRWPLMVLLGAVGAVLLIACANVANLLLARADVRHREIAVRAALGASRADLVRQALVESLLLSGMGGVAGGLVALGATRGLSLVSATSLPRVGPIVIDIQVLGVAAAATLASGVLFGAMPAWRRSRPDVVGVLGDGGRGGTISAARQAFRRGLVVAQLAGALTLLVGAGVLLRSLVEMNRVDLGFDDRHVLTAQIQLPPADYPQPADLVRFYRELTDRLAAAPGVEAAGAVRVLPLSRTLGDWSITIEGRVTQPNENPNADYQAATPGYFAALRVPLVRGRFFTDQDREGLPVVAVINEVMAGRYWPGEAPLGKRFRMGTADQPWVTIVGIIGQVRHNAVIEPPRAEMYLPHAQLPDEIGSTPRAMAVTIRTTGDPLASVDLLRETVRAMDRRLPLADVRSLEAVTAESLAAPRFTTVALGSFAVMALLVAAVGVYGTIALLVSQRGREIGIRLALGATPGSVFRLVVGQGLGLAAVGTTVGLAGAALLSRTLEGLVYGVRPVDPFTFAAVPLVLGLVVLVATAGPAWRAARLDPTMTLRD